MQMRVTTWNTEPYSNLTGGGLTWDEPFSLARLMEFMGTSKFPITLQKDPMLWVFIYGISGEEGRALMDSAPKEAPHEPVPPIFPGCIAPKPADPVIDKMREEFLQAINQADTVEKLKQVQSEWLGSEGKIVLALRHLPHMVSPQRQAERGKALDELVVLIRKTLKEKGI